ncbi:MAG: glycosyltransferase family 2 protein [Actinomycetales bacterium]|nr:glycosyltransferase family 2 protein [Actinomycetales bacterium]
MPDPNPGEARQAIVPASISVALCTFNGEKYLAAQLDSIIGQTLPPTEIVISDDGSTDGTLAIIASYVARSTESARGIQIRALEPIGRQGVVANFDRAIAACSGSFIALCDQDDVWVDDKLARLTSFFQAHPECLLAHTDALLVDSQGQSLGHTLLSALRVTAADKARIHSGGAQALLLRHNFVTGATVMFKRELFSRVRPFPPGWIHDEWLAIAAAVTCGIDLLDEPLVLYRQHGSNEIGAQKLTLRILGTRFFGSRRDRNQRLLLRSQSLFDRVQRWEPALPVEILDACAQKLEHERVRSALPVSRTLRFRPILRELSTGRYGSFGNGLGDALRDGLQSA